jgi:hypothetical protein
LIDLTPAAARRAVRTLGATQPGNTQPDTPQFDSTYIDDLVLAVNEAVHRCGLDRSSLWPFHARRLDLRGTQRRIVR